jgi:hypothetical protein
MQRESRDESIRELVTGVQITDRSGRIYYLIQRRQSMSMHRQAAVLLTRHTIQAVDRKSLQPCTAKPREMRCYFCNYSLLIIIARFNASPVIHRSRSFQVSCAVSLLIFFIRWVPFHSLRCWQNHVFCSLN